MEIISTSEELKNAIRLVEAEHVLKGQLLKEQLMFTYESLKPVNMIRRAMTDITSSPDLIDNILSTSMGVASGFISKKVFVGSSDNSFRKLLGSIVQISVSSLVSRNSEAIKSFVQFVFQNLLQGKKVRSTSPVSEE